jgi:hypothetical protein
LEKEILDNSHVHTFHIPVLGLAFSVDTPIRVSRFGISSVISIVDDMLIEHMRKQYSALYGEPYKTITVRENDYRARRIAEYLDLLQRIVHKQVESLKASAFETGSEIVKYFTMLPDQSPLKALYNKMMATENADKKKEIQNELRSQIVAGAIDVNIMTKLDKANTGPNKELLASEFSDALASLRGFALSVLCSSVVLSAGLNQRLFQYIGQRPEFLPDKNGLFSKKIILKVSDYRSALVQGKMLAKKNVWISEYRIESGLNCGGHVFPTDGHLLGPILEEFKKNRQTLLAELQPIYAAALAEKGIAAPSSLPFRITVQGGIGTAAEDIFLRSHYQVDGTGWGSPFLLVPEATNVDEPTRQLLASAKKEDYYTSGASPLGIPFNNIHGSSSEIKTQERFLNENPGSICTKKFLISNTEFTTEPICTASRLYQGLKIAQLKAQNLLPDVLRQKISAVVEKVCLCEDLSAPGIINSHENANHNTRAVAVCPGPNLAYFSKIASLEEMVGHIYGRVQLLNEIHRPNMFINELQIYVDYMKNEIQRRMERWNIKEQKYFDTFRKNLQEGIAHYKELIPQIKEETERYRETMCQELCALEEELLAIVVPSAA